jgi:hypothetical protein
MTIGNIWYNLWPFGTDCGHLVYFFPIWYVRIKKNLATLVSTSKKSKHKTLHFCCFCSRAAGREREPPWKLSGFIVHKKSTQMTLAVGRPKFAPSSILTHCIGKKWRKKHNAGVLIENLISRKFCKVLRRRSNWVARPNQTNKKSHFGLILVCLAWSTYVGKQTYLAYFTTISGILW